ncbi:unnamed protein product [Calicophoron daubneyi]|uniref:TRPM SLOG domain-containing protein n=1 Tax=Calicophoron daubneyi TaxID=300641 RepID=A0AAV2TW69_CALDB
MSEQPTLQRIPTIRRGISRNESMAPADSTGVSALAASVVPNAQASVRKSSVLQKFVGEIEFTGMNQTAKFAKLKTAPSDSIIRDLLKRKWNLKPPTLIITVFGTDFEKKRKLKMIFKKGLWKAAESGCWIVTGGFNMGIMKLTGEAVRDYTDAYGGNRMMAFGVASWDCVTKNDILEAALHEGTAVYQSEVDNEEQEEADLSSAEPSATSEKKIIRTDIEERPLDPNHSYFILLDSGTNDQMRGKETEMRVCFERCISQWSVAPKKVEQPTGSSGAAGVTSSTQLQQQQTGSTSQPGLAPTIQSTGSIRREGSIMASSVPASGVTQQSATSVTKASGGAVGSSTSLGHSKTPADALSSSQAGATKVATDTPHKQQKAEKTVGKEEQILVPMCGLVVGGDRFTLRQVYYSMIQNRCPIVVTKGTSGCADAIAFGVDAAQKMATEEVIEEKETIPLEKRIESIVEEFLSDFHKDNPNFAEEAAMLCEIINEYSNLVSIFDMEEDSDLDGYMISSLLSSAGSIVASHQINLEQLEITLTLNRADIAREKIFLENKKWKRGQLNSYMYQALMGDRHDFVKLFLEQGFSLEEFLTSSKVALRDVGKVIKSLVGDFYHPLYLSKEFQAKLIPDKHTNATDSINNWHTHPARNHSANAELWFPISVVENPASRSKTYKIAER